MPIIYEPRGKAREYSELAVNLYTGCSHACRYCYCPAILRKTMEVWACDPQPRRNVLRELERDAKKLQGDTREILLSFMSDPYHSDDAARLTREALLLLKRYNLRVQVLTKGGLRSRLVQHVKRLSATRIGRGAGNGADQFRIHLHRSASRARTAIRPSRHFIGFCSFWPSPSCGV